MKTNKVAITLNMICLIIEYIIMSNLNNTLFITIIKLSDNKNKDSHVLERRRVQPNEFNNGVSQKTVFKHDTRSVLTVVFKH